MAQAAKAMAVSAGGTKARQIRCQIVDIEVEIECMRADYVRVGERSDWGDPSLDARYEDICHYEDVVAKLRGKLERLAQAAARWEEHEEQQAGAETTPQTAA